jgi:CheY-like chemotaxis protein
MDLQMPILSGYDATKQIREFDKDIPIVALTAAAMIEDKEKVLASGMNDHLGKPINSDDLYNTIIKYTNKISDNIFITSTTSRNSDNIILDWDLLDRTLSSKELIHKLLFKFLEQLNNDFANIVEKVKNNEKDVDKIIHGLKGVSGNLGATSLFSICEKIDKKYKNNSAISLLEIEALENEITKVKFELNFLNEVQKNEDIEIKNLLNKEEFKELLNSVKSDLQTGSIISKNSLKIFYLNLETLLNSDDISKLKESIDDFEYNLALEILEKLDV